jgi:hypothetical protein
MYPKLQLADFKYSTSPSSRDVHQRVYHLSRSNMYQFECIVLRLFFSMVHQIKVCPIFFIHFQ